ncbi:hypothetical protein [Nonomuraea typhae]|uniref:Uncharacterized protein n=1 Tax=Nonomuraea typhae TaxID=2603600 RepID=A0ABW7YZF2_9ACTN
MRTEALNRLHRSMVHANLALERILQHFGIEDVTDEEVDAALDAR